MQTHTSPRSIHTLSWLVRSHVGFPLYGGNSFTNFDSTTNLRNNTYAIVAHCRATQSPTRARAAAHSCLIDGPNPVPKTRKWPEMAETPKRLEMRENPEIAEIPKLLKLPLAIHSNTHILSVSIEPKTNDSIDISTQPRIERKTHLIEESTS